MSAFTYEREDYQQNLARLYRKGTYQEYENAIFEMNILRNEFRESIDKVSYIDDVMSLIDQVDNIYYGDIGFHCSKPLDSYEIFMVAGELINVLRDCHAENCHHFSIYYNHKMQMFMYTKVVIEADDGPNLYMQGTDKFIVR